MITLIALSIALTLGLLPGPAMPVRPVALTSPSASPSASDSFPATDSSLAKLYPFLRLEQGQIQQKERLAPFFRRLSQLQTGEAHRVRIVHIGDSHIQADFMTAWVRNRLQARFGSAGRGFVFPYQVAQTNSPTDIHSTSNQPWAYRRRGGQPSDLPIGIAGITVEAKETPLWLDISLRPDTLPAHAFDRIALFGQSGPAFLNWQLGTLPVTAKLPPPGRQYHRVRPGENLSLLANRYGVSVSQLQSWNGLRGSMIRIGQRLIVGMADSSESAFDAERFQVSHQLLWRQEEEQSVYEVLVLDSTTHRLILYADEQAGQSGRARLYGLSLENSQAPGLLYHAIGVNGVTYQYYNRAPLFWEQLPKLQADLIIVSLGANETAGAGFKAAEFEAEVQRFLQQVARYLPETPVLLCSPADALRRGRYENDDITVARDILQAAAVEHGQSFWDLYELMGGGGSIRPWRAAGLAARDFLHFQRSGYRLQGELFYRSLMNAYVGY